MCGPQNGLLSGVGFEPTPTYVDQNALLASVRGKISLESGALDHSAILTMCSLLKVDFWVAAPPGGMAVYECSSRAFGSNLVVFRLS